MKRFYLTAFILLFLLTGRGLFGDDELKYADIQGAAHRYLDYLSVSGFSQEGSAAKIDSLYRWLVGDSVIFWEARLKPAGFIILSNRREIAPVLAFSFESDFYPFTAAGTSSFWWLIKSDLSHRRSSAENAESIKQWQALLNGTMSDFRQEMLRQNARRHTQASEKDAKEVYFLDTPKWGQGYANGDAVFNMYTPYHWSVGCVATALSEIFAYYQWPPTGSGYHSYYEDDGGTLSADFENTWYHLDETLDQYYNHASTAYQRELAGQISFHSAVSLEMDFESGGSTSSTSDADNSLRDYFRYSAHYMSVGTDFFTQLMDDMIDYRPGILALAGPVGHAVVVDGYATANGFFHLNMGWNGSNNAWYDISGTFNASGYGNATVVGGVKGIVPSPMIDDDLIWITDDSLIISWSVSPRLNADSYQIQMLSSGSVWTTLSDSWVEEEYPIRLPGDGDYYFRVRAKRNTIWWDYSEAQQVSIGDDVELIFSVDFSFQPLNEGESLILIGNIPPLGSVQNSPVFELTDSANIYQSAVIFDNNYIGDTLAYRFGLADSSGYEIETNTRYYSIGGIGQQELPTVYYNDCVSLVTNSVEPESMKLIKAYPNPFNAITRIELAIPTQEIRSLGIYDLRGRKIREFDLSELSGQSSLIWNGETAGSGVYLVQVINRIGSRYVEKLALIK